MKAKLYKTTLFFRKFFWTIKGCRTTKIMGQRLSLAPDSTLLLGFKDMLLRGHWKSRIVNHSDSVQMHCLCEAISKSGPRPFIVDVGAYQGLYALLAGHLVREREGKVLAIEPIPDNFKILEQNIRMNHLNDIVIPVQCAVS